MQIVTPRQMAKIEERSETLGVSRKQLMENAGKALADLIDEHCRSEKGNKCDGSSVVFLTGKGNNGGDCFAAANILVYRGFKITIIDVGGQDTKVIIVEHGMVQDFLMNDKCSAGTGKFLEIMANRLGVTLQELFDMAEAGTVLPISSLCTVFAESEVINYIGEGRKRGDIAAGVVDSVATKVAQLSQRKTFSEKAILTGGLSDSTYFTKILSEKVNHKVETTENGRYAGALGAALLAREKSR